MNSQMLFIQTVQKENINGVQLLNEFNHGKNVYSVNSEYAKREVEKKVVSKTDDELSADETNTITTSDGQEFRVIATKSHRGTGFDGLAVAPIVNGQPDYKSIAVIAAGTDPGSPTKIDRCNTPFSFYSVIWTNLIV